MACFCSDLQTVIFLTMQSLCLWGEKRTPAIGDINLLSSAQACQGGEEPLCPNASETLFLSMPV